MWQQKEAEKAQRSLPKAGLWREWGKTVQTQPPAHRGSPQTNHTQSSTAAVNASGAEEGYAVLTSRRQGSPCQRRQPMQGYSRGLCTSPSAGNPLPLCEYCPVGKEESRASEHRGGRRETRPLRFRPAPRQARGGGGLPRQARHHDKRGARAEAGAHAAATKSPGECDAPV